MTSVHYTSVYYINKSFPSKLICQLAAVDVNVNYVAVETIFFTFKNSNGV